VAAVEEELVRPAAVAKRQPVALEAVRLAASVVAALAKRPPVALGAVRLVALVVAAAAAAAAAR
jgi:hypothetical protein